MAIKVLLNTSASSFFQNNLLDYGNIYATSNVNDDLNINTNLHSLVFDISLLNTETREQVTLKQIVSLKISNDPSFDVPSVFEITNWPNGTSYNSNFDYIFTFNPEYTRQGNLNNSLEMGLFTEQAGTGKFIVNNWPLSAEGGLSKVYYQIIVKDTSDNYGTYPDNYGGYGEILWQAYPPSTPGIPELESNINSNYTGKDSTWFFRSSEDLSDSIYRTGISRYLGDILEVRYDFTNSQYFLQSTLGNSSNVYRSLAPSVLAQNTALTYTGYKYDYSSKTISTDTGSSVVVGSNLIIPLTSSYSRGAAIYATEQCDLTNQNAPDFAFQVSMNFGNTANTTHLNIRLQFGQTLPSGSTIPSSYYYIDIDLNPETKLYTTTLYKKYSFVISNIQNLILPETIYQDILSGGIFEIYIQNGKYISAYFTPDSRKTESIKLINAYNIETFNTLSGSIAVSSINNDAEFVVNELVQAQGKFLLGVDLGDCNQDGVLQRNQSVVNITGYDYDWITSYNNGDWTVNKNDKPTYSEFLSGSTITPYRKYINVNSTTSSIDSLLSINLLCNQPTYSENANVTLNVNITSGDFYIFFTNNKFYNVIDINENMSEPLSDILEIVFSSSKNGIFITQRNNNHTIYTKQINNFKLTNFTVNVQLLKHKLDNNIDGSFIYLEIDDSTTGNVITSTEFIPAFSANATSGLGWYVGFGGSTNNGSINYNVYQFRSSGILPVTSFNKEEQVNIKHFTKSNSGLTYQKRYLGQTLISSLTEENDVYYGNIKSVGVPLALTTNYAIEPGVTTISDINNYIANTLPANTKFRPLQEGDYLLYENTNRILYKAYAGLIVNTEQSTIVQSMGDIISDNYYGYYFYDGSSNYYAAYISGNPHYSYEDFIWNVTCMSDIVPEIIDQDGSIIQPFIIDGYTLNPADYFYVYGDGIYQYILTETSGLYHYAFNKIQSFTDGLIKVQYGDIYGSTSWYINTYLENKVISNVYFTNMILDIDVNNILTLTANLLEFKIKKIQELYPGLSPAVRFYSGDINGTLSPLTGWIYGQTSPNNNLVQINDINLSSVEIGSSVWVAIQIPFGYELYAANILKPNTITVLNNHMNLVDGVWYKLFSEYSERHSNTSHLSVLQSRIAADTHARISSQFSNLSNQTLVDILPPIKDNSNATPTLSYIYNLAPSVNQAQLTITAIDQDSGLLAFRIVRESHNTLMFTPWLNWNSLTISELGTYTCYLNTDLDGYSGSRKVWVQIADQAGNITETNPITLLEQKIALIDTVPPRGSIQFVSGMDGSPIELINQQKSWLKINGVDDVTDVKDFRYREYAPGSSNTWSNYWIPNSEYLPYSFANSEDGIKRIEVQFRDYGNNVMEADSLTEMLYNASDRNVLFIDSTEWNNVLYFSAIKHYEYNNYSLINSNDSTYAGNTAFYAISPYGSKILFRSTDRVTVSNSATFTIDSVRGLIVFDAPQSPYPTVTVIRDSAQLWAWDGMNVFSVADLGYKGEKAILSMLPTDNYLYIGTNKGNIYACDGKVINGPVFTCSSNNTSLPVTMLTEHQFQIEKYYSNNTSLTDINFEDIYASNNISYIYAGTSNVPRLFRAPTHLAINSSSWELVSYTGFLATSSGDITCATSAYDKLFIGTNQSKILTYRRILDQNEVIETLNEIDLINTRIGSINSDSIPVSTLITSGKQIFAGIGDRPEIWTYYEKMIEPQAKEKWVVQNSYKNPWQPYISFTNDPLNNAITTVQTNNNDITPSNINALKINSGTNTNSIVTLTANTGSDWEQTISKNLPSNAVINVICATTENISLSGLNQTIDGFYVSVVGTRILVKNQTNPIQNGVYLAASGSWTRASELPSSNSFGVNTGVYVEKGDTQYSTTWLTTTSGTVGVSPILFSKPQYTFELGMMYYNTSNTISSTPNRQGFQISDGYWYYDVQLSPSDIIITSGDNQYSYQFGVSNITPVSPITSFSVSDEQMPTSGNYIMWNFNGSNSLSNYGPFYPNDTTSTASSTNWAGENTGPSNAYINNLDYVSGSLHANINNDYDPVIYNLHDQFKIDTQSKIKIRMKVTPRENNSVSTSTLYSEPFENILENIRLKVSINEFADSANDFYYWTDTPLVNELGFVTYEFSPQWHGMVKDISFSLTYLPTDQNRPTDWYIDYIAVVTDTVEPDALPNLRYNITPIRVGVDGRDIKVWIGKTDTPIIDVANFLTLPTSNAQIRFGKTNPLENNSVWLYGDMKFVTGSVIPPVTRKIYNFALQSRLPSTGGVRKLVNHLGTVYALTDGISKILKSDNPDDRASKMFIYDSNNQTWVYENPPYPRKTDGTGVIRPLSASSYKGTLIVSGQKGTIRSPY